MANQPTESDFASRIEAFQAQHSSITAELGKVIVGHQSVIEEVLICLLAGGHALLEGVPGLGKTLLVRTLAETLDVQFNRIQFTPDLMPADITGTNIVVGDGAGGKQFEFQAGPIFANLILADEINRATPKTQSAVLEAMAEQTVSVARTTHQLPAPFMILATQNPLEMEGTYPLPEAQLDRFMLKIVLESPPANELVSILDRTTGAETPAAAPVATGQTIIDMRQTVRQVEVASAVTKYIADIVLATAPESDLAPQAASKYVRYGSSPRGAQSILLAAKVRALVSGRANAALSDVRKSAPAALRHRLILSFEGQADSVTTDDVIAEVLETVKSE
ncbi:MAG: MoxR family ATPase [Phycisphaerae bacterium]|jgi:MoxR-like ATPase|nr:MoxR family ATPase [Phycisphaerae bacterium]